MTPLPSQDAPATPAEAERKAFEAWVDARPGRLRNRLDGDGDSPLGKLLWEAWQARAASAAPAAVVPELPEDGFVWMTHPSRFDGKPLPVWTYVQHGVRFYIPFDDTAMDFEWEERDDEWQIASSPAPERIDADKLHRDDDGEIYTALTLASFIIKCQRDGVDIGDKLPDGLARIEQVRESFAARHAAAELVSTALGGVPERVTAADPQRNKQENERG